MNGLKVLVVDDELGYRVEISEYLRLSGFAVVAAGDPTEALAVFDDNTIDIAILDLRLPEISGLELMKLIQRISPETAVIIISGHGDMDSVIKAMREGAMDFFSKPFDLVDIRIALERSKKYLDLQKKLSDVSSSYDLLLKVMGSEHHDPIIGQSSIMSEVIYLMNQVGSSPETDVLITGESGTGKELVARGIHRLGDSAAKPFCDVNCTAIPETLFESEFFGHTKNAFTGAQSEKKGWFETANGGTIFLDEIGDLPLAMQAKLLRVLEERKIRRVGSTNEISLKLRVIASTNRDLKAMIGQKLFREDLYYRLNRFAIHIPPLRQRPEDIPQLLDYYLQSYLKKLNKADKKLSDKALACLKSYCFPGNVRELKNMVERALILSPQGEKVIGLIRFPDLLHIQDDEAIDTNSDCLDLKILDRLEKQMINRALSESGSNKTKAALLLNITRTSLNRRLKKYGLDSLD